MNCLPINGPPDRHALRSNPELASLVALGQQAFLTVEALAAVYQAQNRDPVLQQHARVVADHAQQVLLAVEAYRRILEATPDPHA